MNRLQTMAIAFAFAIAAGYVGERIIAKYKIHVVFRAIAAVLFSLIFILLIDPTPTVALLMFGYIMYGFVKKSKAPSTVPIGD